MTTGAAAAPSSHEYRPDIDGLRAVAVALVIVFHASPDVLPGGFIGVDVFFVISGYLITSIILRETRSQTFTLSNFYARRCRRILPALAVVLVAAWAISRVALPAGDARLVGKHILGGSTFTSNILFWREAGYFDIASTRKPLLHLWSLGVEEQFYLVWPPILMVAVLRRWRPLLLAVALMAGSLALGAVLIAADAAATFYLLPTRMWELLAGAVLVQTEWARTIPEPGAFHRLEPEGKAALGLLLIGGASLYDPGAGQARLWFLLAPVIGAVLVISARGALINRVVLAGRLPVWVGLISYPLYLWHWPLLSLVTLLAGNAPLVRVRTLKGGAIALAFVLRVDDLALGRTVGETIRDRDSPRQAAPKPAGARPLGVRPAGDRRRRVARLGSHVRQRAHDGQSRRAAGESRRAVSRRQQPGVRRRFRTAAAR